MAGTGRRKSGEPGTAAGAGAGRGEAPARAGRRGRGVAGAGPAAAEPRNGRSSAATASLEEPVAGGHAMIDLEFLRGLIGAVDASSIDSIEITRAGTRIRISKTPPPAPAGVAGPAMAAVTSAPMPPAPAYAQGAAAAAAPAPAAEAPPARSDLLEIKSPMVGTFYRSPAPEAPSYVEVGSQVTKGQTLCILEAMKLMNELESEVEGIVREVLVENAEPVEFGQVLFRIEPTKR